MNELMKPIAKAFGTDVDTMWKSIFSGTSSTGVGIYMADISSLNWQFELNLISLFWGSMTCIVLTMLSLLVSDLYKFCKRKLFKSKPIDKRG